MKLAIDIHGVIDKDPIFFQHMCQALVSYGTEVHILTGKHLRNGIMDELKELGFERGIHYTHIFSISDHHEKIGTKMWGDVKNPWMDDETWNKTKGRYCEINEINLCIDDKADYLPHFITPIALYSGGQRDK